jgi:peptidoglycan/xylan/chitin deacetylase (PgdA/CDA1 family)
MRRLLFGIIVFLGIPRLFRELFQKKAVSVVLFHTLSPASAERIFSFVKKNYGIIDLSEYIQALQEKSHGLIPRKAMIITFDDGIKENYKLLPVIKKHNIPVTIFLCSEIIGTSRHFWYTFRHPAYTIGQLKNMSDEARIDTLKCSGFDPLREMPERQALSIDEIQEMKSYVNFQSHTRFHPALPMCSLRDARAEIEESKNRLEALLKKPVNTIAYPFGYYSERDLAICRQAGYLCGLTVDYGFNGIETDPFRIKRLNVNDPEDINEFIIKSSGMIDFFKTRNGRLKRGIFPNREE